MPLYVDKFELDNQEILIRDNETRALIDNIPIDRKFILIGDSFAGGVDGNNNTQTVSGGGWATRFKDQMNGVYDVYINTRVLGGNYGFASSRPFLDVLQAIETDQTYDKDKITDIVVIGGTNDIGISETDIQSAINTFCTYVHTNYPNAKLKIGVIGTAISDLCGSITNAYRICTQYGAEFISDTRGLFCLREYIGTDTVHLTLQGYQFYQKFINNAILSGRCPFIFNSTSDTVTFDTTYTSTSGDNFTWTYMINEKAYRVGIITKAGTSLSQSGDLLLSAYTQGYSQNAIRKVASGCPVKLPSATARVQTPRVYSQISGRNILPSLSLFIQNDGAMYGSARNCDTTGNGSIALLEQNLQTFPY